MPLYVYPFSEIVEQAQREMREKSSTTDVRGVYKRRVNFIYQRDLPSYYEWDWLQKAGTITLAASYSTGTVTISSGSSSVTGTGTTWTSAMTGRKIKFGGNDEVYAFTFVTATTGTISPSLTGPDSITAGSYSIYQDIYSLPEDYSRMSVEPGVFYNVSGGRYHVIYADEEKFRRRKTTTPSDFVAYWREAKERTSLGVYQLEVTPPPSRARILNFEYQKALPELTEYRSATATTTAGSTTVIFNKDISSAITAGQYFSVDNDGTGQRGPWVRVNAVVGLNDITLDTAYPTANSATASTVCDAPDIPPEMQKMLLEGACWRTAMDQNDPAAEGRLAEYRKSIDEAMKIKARKRFGRSYIKSWRIR